MILKLSITAFIAAQMFGLITLAQTNQATPTPAPSSPPRPPNSLISVRRALREFDRFLDHHPVLEEELRLSPGWMSDQALLEKNPELRAFLLANPSVAQAMKVYPRYFLYRALLREASAPVAFRELTAFKDIFEVQPKLEQQLTTNPELIRDSAFLGSHTELHDFLVQHAALGRVFLPPAPAPKAN